MKRHYDQGSAYKRITFSWGLGPSLQFLLGPLSSIMVGSMDGLMHRARAIAEGYILISRQKEETPGLSPAFESPLPVTHFLQ